MQNVKQILIYTRPWEVDFHLALAADLQAKLPGIPVVFATFFETARVIAVKAGYEVVYLPQRLLKARDQVVPAERLREIDDSLRETTGAGLNLMLHAERFRPTQAAECERFFHSHVAVLDALVVPGTISISSMYDHFVYWLAGGLANSRGGWHFAFVGCGMPAGRTIALRTPWETWRVPLDEQESRCIWEAAQRSLEVPMNSRIDYMKPVRARHDWAWACARLQEIREREIDYRSGSYFQPRIYLTQWISDVISQRMANAWACTKNRLFDIRRDGDIGKLSQKYFYVPLHMEPEASIFMYSPWLHNQIEMCRLIAQSLPVGCLLVAKENPKMLATRAVEFYNILRAIPNVRLAHPDVDSLALIKASIGVVTLAGTAAVEAAALGRPSLTLASPPFRRCLNAGNLLGVDGLAGLPALLREWCDEGRPALDSAGWRRWVEGTFVANVVPRFSGGRITVAINENVEISSSYIMQAIHVYEQERADANGS